MTARARAASPSPHASSHRLPAPLVARDDRELRTGLAELLPELRARALRLCGDRAAADDVVQDTFERALRFADTYERGTNLRAWALRVLFSVFVTKWRRRRRERTALEGLAADPCAWTAPDRFGPPDAGAGALTRSTCRKLQALPDGFREAVVMVDLRELSYREAARELGVPVGTVMSRLHRGRKLLAAEMAGECEAA
jgi:RNA polymerase sigma-70 factor (ECF subfamily)